MAKFDYQKTLATVNRLLNKFGDIQSVTKVTKGAYDPVTETFASSTPITEKADGVLVGIGDDFLDNSLVKRSDSKLLIVAISEPQVGDVYTVNGKSYNYIAHDTVDPAGTICLYKIALRI